MVAQASSRVQVQHTFILQAHLAVVTSQVPPRHFCVGLHYFQTFGGGPEHVLQRTFQKAWPWEGLEIHCVRTWPGHQGPGVEDRDQVPVLLTSGQKIVEASCLHSARA